MYKVNFRFSYRALTFLKSKTKEPPKSLSSSGIRSSKFIFVYNVPAHPLFRNQRILNLMAVGDTKLRLVLLRDNENAENILRAVVHLEIEQVIKANSN